MSATVESIRTDLLARGYVEVESHTDRHGERRPGTRVRHRSEQFTEAYVHGSGVVRAVFVKDPSAWSQQWGDDDVEMAVEFDKGWRAGDVSLLAQYHTALPDGAQFEGHRCKWCDPATEVADAVRGIGPRAEREAAESREIEASLARTDAFCRANPGSGVTS